MSNHHTWWYAVKSIAKKIYEGQWAVDLVYQLTINFAGNSVLLHSPLPLGEAKLRMSNFIGKPRKIADYQLISYSATLKDFEGKFTDNDFELQSVEADGGYTIIGKLIPSSEDEGTFVFLHFPNSSRLRLGIIVLITCLFYAVLIFLVDFEMEFIVHFIFWAVESNLIFRLLMSKSDKERGTTFWSTILQAKPLRVNAHIKKLI